eukprot:TRINITY_DN7351_c0_g1_i1.p1 TRINITY_DN7351_c0_g1~~TRINITY_DN7351_c0_g1_i1.p1  ORF type:complete len:565 (-),score=134.05 TRINITY_DN7351_c0_g1_i1:19-1713(-)
MELDNNEKIEENEVLSKSEWKDKFLSENYPPIHDLLSRIDPLIRAIQFCKLYHPKRDLNHKLNEQQMLQLISQHLDFSGLHGSLQTLELESNLKYERKIEMQNSKMLILLRESIKNIERIYDCVLSKGGEQKLEDILYDFNLIPSDENTENDVDIWEKDQEKSLQFTENTDQVKAGSFNALVIELTNPDTTNMNFLKTFLMTYQSFTQPINLLFKLFNRFNVPQDSEKKLGDSTVLKIKTRVVNVLKQWMSSYPEDFDRSMSLTLGQFISSLSGTFAMSLKRPFVALISGTKEKILTKTVEKIEHEPLVDLSTIFKENLSLDQLNDEEIARQLTLVSHESFCLINSTEFLNQAWNNPKLKHKAINLINVIDLFNKIGNWVVSTILSKGEVKKRAQYLSKFINIAFHLKELKCYNVLMAIIAGLNNSSVSRLNWTFKEVKPNKLETLHQLEQFMSRQQSFKNYREAIAQISPPCTPYLGLVLTDLTFIDENPNHIDHLINWTKRKLIFDAIQKVIQFQDVPYNYLVVHQIQSFLKHQFDKPFTESDVYRLSLSREPRNCSRHEIN